jgi:hypothetical protein
MAKSCALRYAYTEGHQAALLYDGALKPFYGGFSTNSEDT